MCRRVLDDVFTERALDKVRNRFSALPLQRPRHLREPVDLRLKLTLALPGHEPRELEGTIVRVEDNTLDPDGLWRHRVAVAFDERVEALESVLEEVSRASQPPPSP